MSNRKCRIRQRKSGSDYLAAERTLLASIRTGLGLMGFGFVVARFGLFLQQLRAAQGGNAARPYGLSVWFGIALIVVGVFVNIFAGWHHLQLVRELDSRPNGTLSCFDRGCGDCSLSCIDRARNVYLSDAVPMSIRDRATSVFSRPWLPKASRGVQHGG